VLRAEATTPPEPDRSGYDANRLREIALAFEQERTVLVRRLYRALRRVLDDIGGEVLAAIRAAGPEGVGMRIAPGRVTLAVPPEADEAMDPDRMSRRLAEAARGPSRYGILLGGTFERTTARLASQYHPWHEGMDAMDRFAAEWATEQRYLGVAETVKGQYIRAVQEEIKAGATWDEMVAGIQDRFDGINEVRAATVADTEATKLYGAGGHAFRTEYGIPKKQWVCSFYNSRDTHIAAHGQVRRQDEEFEVGLDRMLFPGRGSRAEENVNCHCIVIGVGSPTVPNTRAERAKASHVPMSKRKERIATRAEQRVARAIDGKRTGDNKPVDVVSPDGKHGVEVKAVIDAKEMRIYMRKECRERKLAWAKQHKQKLHTVAVYGREVYHREGVGSFSLSTMTRLESFADLSEVIR